MRRIVIFAAVLAVAVTGCAYLKQVGSALRGKGQQAGSKLTSDDRVMLETYYGAQSYAPPTMPPKMPPNLKSFGIKTNWLPGEIHFEGIVMVEPLRETGREPHKNKAIRVGITGMTYVIDGKKGDHREHISYLDESEARDFDVALSYFAETAAKWAAKKPEPQQALVYQARDSFSVRLSFDFDDEGPTVLARSGETPTAGAVLQIPVANIGDVQGKLRAALKTLETN